MKKLINAVDRAVIERLEGMALAHPELRSISLPII
jgi:hypothetical protein